MEKRDLGLWLQARWCDWLGARPPKLIRSLQPRPVLYINRLEASSSLRALRCGSFVYKGGLSISLSLRATCPTCMRKETASVPKQGSGERQLPHSHRSMSRASLADRSTQARRRFLERARTGEDRHTQLLRLAYVALSVSRSLPRKVHQMRRQIYLECVV
jgi:hypothetical protein